ncbi:MAG TPA: fibronectin type III domain-containing protein, partial [Candidatus Aquicultor sp.]
FVTYSVAAGATVGATLGAQLSFTGLGVKAPDIVSTQNLPATTGLHIIENSVDTISVSHTPPADFTMLQGTSGILDVITLTAPTNGDGAELGGIKVDLVGTAVPSDVAFLRLYDDVDGSGTLNAGDTLLDTKVPSTGTVGFTLPPGFKINPGPSGARHLLIEAEASPLAKVRATIKANLVNSSYVVLAAPDTVDPSTFPLTSATTTIGDAPDKVTVSQTAVDGGNVVIGTANHVMQVIDLTINADSAVINSLTVERTGTATDSDIALNSVKLWYDADNSNSLTPADWQLSSSKTFMNGKVTFDNIKLAAITPTSPVKLLVTYSVTQDAVMDIGKTIGASIETSASVGIVPPDYAELSTTPLVSALHTIAPMPPTAPTGLKVTAGANNRFTLQWNNNPASEQVTIYKIYRANPGSETFVPLPATAATSTFVDTVPSPGDYSYKVSAVNSTGESVLSAAAIAESVDLSVTISSASATTTIESANETVKLLVPPSPGYLNKKFTIKSAVRPPGVRMVSRFYYELSTDATQPLNPALTLILRCNGPIDPAEKKVSIYHYTSDHKWERVAGSNGQYIYDGYSGNNSIGYTGITTFSGYAAAENSFGGYGYPLRFTDAATKGPHGGYTSTTNKCKECHAVHLATGAYDLTRANTRNETCEFCHGIGGAAATQIVLDEGGHGLSQAQKGQDMVTAPDDTEMAYTKRPSDWGCLECHSVHDNKTVKLAGFTSNKLLKANPNPQKNGYYLYYTPTTGETSQTISQWCSTCHNANFGIGTDGLKKTVQNGGAPANVYGHPSSSEGATTTPDGFAVVNLNDGINNGPACQQCHVADGRTGVSEFPHSSGSEPSMLKTGTGSGIDNVCSGCHNTASLP